MVNDPFLGMLGLARRAGKLAFGDELVREILHGQKGAVRVRCSGRRHEYGKESRILCGERERAARHPAARQGCARRGDRQKRLRSVRGH